MLGDHAERAHEVVVHLLALVVRGGAEVGVLLLQRGDLAVALRDRAAPVGAPLQDVRLQLLDLLVALLARVRARVSVRARARVSIRVRV